MLLTLVSEWHRPPEEVSAFCGFVNTGLGWDALPARAWRWWRWSKSLQIHLWRKRAIKGQTTEQGPIPPPMLLLRRGLVRAETGGISPLQNGPCDWGDKLIYLVLSACALAKYGHLYFLASSETEEVGEKLVLKRVFLKNWWRNLSGSCFFMFRLDC